MKKAFISYRRQDTEGYAHSLYDRLRMNFNNRQIFMDVDDIKPGEDFVKILQDNLKDCAVLIVVIGKQWLDIKNSRGQRRLDNSADFVRIEVATALERGIPVIPVLVNGATMPVSEALPDNLKALSQRHAVVLTGVSYEHGIEQLVSSIERYFGTKRRSRQTAHVPWYKGGFFKFIWISLLSSFFGILTLAAISVLIEEEESAQDRPSPQQPTQAIPDTDRNPQPTVAEKIQQLQSAPPTSIETDDDDIFQLAKVMDPPSNIRLEPNGDIICQATSSSVITIIRIPEIASNGGKWYGTNFCGEDYFGFIHESQIRLRK